jgi:nitroreductase
MNAQKSADDTSPAGGDRRQAPQSAQALLDTIKSRRSVRRFKADPVAEEQVQFLLEAARWAPYTFECWRFVVVDDESLLSTLINLAPGILGHPTLVIAVCADMDLIRSKHVYRELAYQETAVATQNILLAASALGLGGCFIGSFSRKGIATLLNLPQHLEIHNLIALGYPAESPAPPPRSPIPQLSFRNRL